MEPSVGAGQHRGSQFTKHDETWAQRHAPTSRNGCPVLWQPESRVGSKLRVGSGAPPPALDALSPSSSAVMMIRSSLRSYCVGGVEEVKLQQRRSLQPGTAAPSTVVWKEAPLYQILAAPAYLDGFYAPASGSAAARLRRRGWLQSTVGGADVPPHRHGTSLASRPSSRAAPGGWGRCRSACLSS